MITKHTYFKYKLVFNYGYDEEELKGLDTNELKSLWISLLYASKIAHFNGQKAMKLPAGKLLHTRKHK